MVRETFQDSLWASLAPPAPATPSLEQDRDTDVAIVGAGFLGLSTALHLVESGVAVTVLEADEVGFGASGRNTGFVVPHFKAEIGPADVERMLGADAGRQLATLVAGSASIVFDLIQRLRLACEAEQTGWIQPAHTTALARLLEKRKAEWRERGREVETLSAVETTRWIGAPGYHGALLDRTGGQIDPLAYARELARVASEKGLALFTRSRVTALEPVGARWRIRTARGSVLASRVVLATNALVGRLVQEVSGSILPVRVHQIATERLPESLRAAILPHRTPSTDTRRHPFAVRWSADGRLVTGGLLGPGPAPPARAMRAFTRRLERFFPAAAPLRAAHAWSGVIAVTSDFLPRFMAVAPGLDAVIGCNGRGIALTTALGRELAVLIAGQTDASGFPLPHEPPRPFPHRRFAVHAPPLWLPWSSLRDRLEAGR